MANIPAKKRKAAPAKAAAKIKVKDLPEFDAAEYLDDDEAIAEYLTAILEENNPSLLAAALGDIA
jgi:DNA-binding phage protein